MRIKWRGEKRNTTAKKLNEHLFHVENLRRELKQCQDKLELTGKALMESGHEAAEDYVTEVWPVKSWIEERPENPMSRPVAE